MTITDILNYYEEVQEDLKFQNMSSIRTKIMIALSEGPKKIENLQRSTEILPQAILYSIGEFGKRDLVLKDGDYYHLSIIGKEKASELIDMIRTLVVLKNNQKLWIDHEIGAIPNDLLMKIGDLYNSRLIEAENANIDKVHKSYTQIVLKAKKLRGISPIFYLDYTETFLNILRKDVEVELILTEAILRKTIESLDQGKKDLSKLISAGNLTLWEIKEDVKVAFTVTDTCLSLGLFSTKGEYDPTKDLISDDKDAIGWGNKLFDYYLKRAQKVNLEDIIEQISKY